MQRITSWLATCMLTVLECEGSVMLSEFVNLMIGPLKRRGGSPQTRASVGEFAAYSHVHCTQTVKQ